MLPHSNTVQQVQQWKHVAYRIQNYDLLSGRQATAACVFQLAGYKFSPQKQEYRH